MFKERISGLLYLIAVLLVFALAFTACGSAGDEELLDGGNGGDGNGDNNNINITNVTVSGTTLVEKFKWISSNAASNTSYLIEITSNETINPQSLSYSGKSNIYIRLVGIGSERIIDLYGSGSLFIVENGVTLVLGENITLKGFTDNGASLVRVNSGGSLTLNNGAKITGNGNTSSFGVSRYGGGVHISGGTFTMNGGEISGNSAYSTVVNINVDTCGGGVYMSDGTFTMNGGTISSNTSSAIYYVYGGGVYMSGGTFTMNNGTISNNTASASTNFSYGGGVYISNGTLIMNDGIISGNKSSALSASGGGIYMSVGTLTMKGGNISDNEAISSGSASSSKSYGGGLFIERSTLTMSGGKISGNTSSVSGSSFTSLSSFGGGVYMERSILSMSGGEISGNTSSGYLSYGGGVYIVEYTVGVYNPRFEKTGGIITGYSSDSVNGNVVKNQSGVVQSERGHAVYASHENAGYVRRKETTAGTANNLTYIRNEPELPTISGAWDN